MPSCNRCRRWHQSVLPRWPRGPWALRRSSNRMCPPHSTVAGPGAARPAAARTAGRGRKPSRPRLGRSRLAFGALPPPVRPLLQRRTSAPRLLVNGPKRDMCTNASDVCKRPTLPAGGSPQDDPPLPPTGPAVDGGASPPPPPQCLHVWRALPRRRVCCLAAKQPPPTPLGQAQWRHRCQVRPPPPPPGGSGTDLPREARAADSSLPGVFSSISRVLCASRSRRVPPPLQ